MHLGVIVHQAEREAVVLGVQVAQAGFAEVGLFTYELHFLIHLISKYRYTLTGHQSVSVRLSD